MSGPVQHNLFEQPQTLFPDYGPQQAAAARLTQCCAPEMCPTCTDEGGHR